MVSVEDRPTNLTRVVVLPLPNLRSDLIHRPGEGLRFGKPMSCAARNPLNSLSGRHSGRSEQRSIDQHAMHDHGELAGERTFAFFMPARLASRIAQLLSAVQPLSGWVRIMWPAS